MPRTCQQVAYTKSNWHIGLVASSQYSVIVGLPNSMANNMTTTVVILAGVCGSGK